jgi:hypothetical protein
VSEWRHQCAVSFRFIIRLDSPPLERHSRFHYENNPTGISAGVERKERKKKRTVEKMAVSYFKISSPNSTRTHNVDCEMTAGWGTKQCRVHITLSSNRIYILFVIKPSRLVLPSLSTSFSFEFFLGVIIFLPTVSVEKFFRHSLRDSTRAALSSFALEASPPHTLHINSAAWS